jgi:hypothetical protein
MRKPFKIMLGVIVAFMCFGAVLKITGITAETSSVQDASSAQPSHEYASSQATRSDVHATNQVPSPSGQSMTPEEVQHCEMYANITERSMEPLAQLYGTEYVAQKVREKLEANESPACLARLAREWGNQ